VSARRVRVGVVREAARALSRQVLPQGAPERDVHDLKPAADPEDRNPELLRGGKESEVQAVAFRVELQCGCLRRFAIARRVYVSAAREKQAIERAGIRVARAHDDDLFGQGSGREQGAAVGLVRLFRVGRDDDLHGSLKCAFWADGAARGAGGAIIETP